MVKKKWIPSIEVESSHGTREVSLSTRHLMNRTIFLNGDIDSLCSQYNIENSDTKTK